MIHQFKDFVGSDNSCKLEWEGQVSYNPALSTVLLQIYNRNTSAWDTVDQVPTTFGSPLTEYADIDAYYSSIGADIDFILSANMTDLTDYKSSENVISCRVYQEAK